MWDYTTLIFLCLQRRLTHDLVVKSGFQIKSFHFWGEKSPGPEIKNPSPRWEGRILIRWTAFVVGD